MAIELRKDGSGYLLESEMFLNQPLDKVFSFFSKAENLEILTPPMLRFEILSPLPIEMKVGATIDYRIRVHSIPLRWQSEITKWDPPRSFVDEQRRGPYHYWKHTHSFEEKDGGTIVSDSVLYKPIGGYLINKLFVERDVRNIFNFRHEKLQEIFV